MDERIRPLKLTTKHNQRFVSPRMLEIVYPFLVVHLWLDLMEWLDAKLGTPFIRMVDEVGGRLSHLVGSLRRWMIDREPSRLPPPLTKPHLNLNKQLYKRVCGPELLARHPMSYYEAEEDDLLFAINYGCACLSKMNPPY